MARRGKAKTDFEPQHYRILGKSYPIPMLPGGDGGTKDRIIYEATLLFAKNGYAAVSMKDISGAIGVKPASIYNHFAGKEDLWKAVLEHAVSLYLLYLEHLEEEIGQARTFAEVLEVIFDEPRKMKNAFTCYAFSLLQTEQFRDRMTGARFNEVFLKYSIDFFEKHFQKCIAGRLVPPFDARAAATLIMNSVLMAVNVQMHEYLGRKTPYRPGDALGGVHQLLVRLLIPEAEAAPSAPEALGDGGDDA